jgi:hypothetical protein
MKPVATFAILALIPLGCATEVNTPLDGDALEVGSGGGTAGDGAGGSSSVVPTGAGTNATAGTPGAAGTTTETGGTFGSAGTFGMAGTFATGGAGASAGGTPAGGASGSGGTSAGAGGKSTGGAGAGGMPGGAGMAGMGGMPQVGAYCDNQTKSPLPYAVNDGFQPSGWQGDITAISVPAVQPDACTTRPAGAVGNCSKWRFTPNAVTPAWAGVSWSKLWDAQYTHPPVCLAAGATKVSFQARGAAGGEQVTFSAAGGPEVPFTLTNAWKKYEVTLVGVVYNTPADGVDSGFFWKVAPPTPGGGAVTFFVDDIQITQ